MSNKKKNRTKSTVQKATSPSTYNRQKQGKSTQTRSVGQAKFSSKKVKKEAVNRTRGMILIGLLAVAVITAAVVLITRQPMLVNALPETISVADAYQEYQAGTFVLDVRTQEEWDEYHIPQTTHIPLDELESRLGELPQDQEIVVICRSGNRSQDGRDILLRNGFTAVTSVQGGLKEWSLAGYPMEGKRP